MNKVNGVIQAVGDKFNGSVKVNDKWYNFKKGVFKNDVNVGDEVTLTLGKWEFQGKSGENVTNIDVLAVVPEESKEFAKEYIKRTQEMNKPAQVSQGRDFDAENRGKVRHGLTTALVPLVATQTITVNQAKEVVNSLVEFVMKGE